MSFHDGDADAHADAYLRSIALQLPPGLIGSPDAVPTCSPSQLATEPLNQGIPVEPHTACPDASRVGTINVEVATPLPAFPSLPITGGIYNVAPRAGETARLGLILPGGTAGFIIASATALQAPIAVHTESDYALETQLDQLPASLFVGLFGTDVPIKINQMTLVLDGQPAGGPEPDKPFLTLPTTCDPEPLTVTARSYPDSVASLSDKTVTATSYLTATNCSTLPFAPSVAVTPASPTPASPAGYSVNVEVPQDTTPAGRVSAELKQVAISFPIGVAISPAVATGLSACTDADFGQTTRDPVSCPSDSQIGSVRLDTPLLDDPLTGHVYIGTPRDGDPYRLMLLAAGRGLRIKLLGSIRLDPSTGQLRAIFDGLPRVPFSSLHIAFFGGDRAALANPATCGSFATSATFTPWSGQPPVVSTSSFDINGCAVTAPFAPTVTASVAPNTAGEDASLDLTIGRTDADQHLRAARVSMPAGLLAHVGSVPLCGQSQAVSGSCNEASRIGQVRVFAGTGAAPLSLPGSVFLTDGYDGAPFGLAIVIAAKAGPFDLGTVVVRSRIEVRPSDAGLDIITDSFPTILDGIPLNIRTIELRLDREGFLFNPTGCDARTLHASLSSAEGTEHVVDVPWKVDDCEALPVHVALSATVGVQGSTAKGAHPPLVVDLAPDLDATRLKRAEVTFPAAIAANVSVASRACPADLLAQDRCPDTAIVGQATASTPVLSAPLAGPIYVAAQAAGLPKLVVRLRGPISIDLTGALSFGKDGRLTTMFDNIPDVPVSNFKLSFFGGLNGALNATTDLCSAGPLAGTATMVGQSGHAADIAVPIKIEGCTLAHPTPRPKKRRPTLRATVARADHRDLSIAVASPHGPAKLRSVRITLPRSVSIAPGARVRAQGSKRIHTTVTNGRTIVVSGLGARGLKRVSLRLRLSSPPSLRRPTTCRARISLTNRQTSTLSARIGIAGP